MRVARPFDAEAFVDDLLAAGCHMAVHQPIGRDAGAAYWIVYPADLDGTPTEGECTVRARWEASMAACRGHDELVLAACQRRIQATRLHQAARENHPKLGQADQVSQDDEPGPGLSRGESQPKRE